MIEDMTIRNLSRSTQQSYGLRGREVQPSHFGCPLDQLGMEVIHFLIGCIAVDRKYSMVHQSDGRAHC